MSNSYEVKTLLPFGIVVKPISAGVHVDDLAVEPLRNLARQHHLVVLRGFATTPTAEGFADYCERWGRISVWPFGKVLELVEQANPTDHIFDSNYVPLHWDGMYRPQVPEFQMFHCLEAPLGNQGGRTTFSNTKLAWEHAPVKTRTEWEKVTGEYHRKMEFYDSRTIAPIVSPHPTQGFPTIRYNEPPRARDASFLNHPDLTFRGVVESKAFHGGLREALYAPEVFYAHAWEPGDIVISDNYTLLHGREAFTSGAPRHLRRVHVLGQPALNNPHLVSHV